MRAVSLAHQQVPGPRPAVHRALFLHGILGSGANLRTAARRFAAARPGWDAWTVDLRGHGASPKGSPGPSVAAAAADVGALAARSDVPVTAIVAHSFGGKVALEALRAQGPAPTLEHLVILDSPPGPRPPAADGDGALAVLALLRSLPPVFPSPGAFVDAVIAGGQRPELARWLAMSTERTGGAVRFALDLDEIEALVRDYLAVDLWPVVERPPGRAAVALIVGGRSRAFSAGDLERARAVAAREPRVTVDVLPTGHWVHVEDLDGLVRLLDERLPGPA